MSLLCKRYANIEGKYLCGKDRKQVKSKKPLNIPQTLAHLAVPPVRQRWKERTIKIPLNVPQSHPHANSYTPLWGIATTCLGYVHRLDRLGVLCKICPLCYAGRTSIICPKFVSFYKFFHGCNFCILFYNLALPFLFFILAVEHVRPVGQDGCNAMGNACNAMGNACKRVTQTKYLHSVTNLVCPAFRFWFEQVCISSFCF